MQDDPDSSPEQAFAKWVRDLRAQRDMSQSALAEKVGLDATAITKLERGTRAIRLNEAARIARVLGASLHVMLRPPAPSTASRIRELEDRLEQVEEMLRGGIELRNELKDDIAQLRKQLEAEGGDGEG